MDLENSLAHYGVKGMKWGVRKDDRLNGISGRTNREAKKDAREFSRAKMFYGEGAGTRRKLIKASVESKSKKDPNYKKAFDFHIENQDMDRHANKARGERKRKDAVNSTAKTARGIKNLVMGTGAPVALSAVAIYAAAKNPHVQKIVKDVSKTTYETVKNSSVVSILKDQLLKGGR